MRLQIGSETWVVTSVYGDWLVWRIANNKAVSADVSRHSDFKGVAAKLAEVGWAQAVDAAESWEASKTAMFDILSRISDATEGPTRPEDVA